MCTTSTSIFSADVASAGLRVRGGLPSADPSEVRLLRLILLILIVLGAVVWVKPRWNEDERTLTLRLREGDEIVGFVRERARDLGARVVQAASDESESPSVAAGPSDAAPDKLTRDDREALNRLIDEKIRESQRGTSAGEN